VKRLTGGDTIRTHRKYGHTFEFKPIHTLFLATNTQPGVRDGDAAIWDRLRLIPFNHTFKPDRRLPRDKVTEMFAAEGSGVLTWIVQGAIDYLWHSLGDEPSAVRHKTREYQENEDLLGQFIADRCSTEPDQKETTKNLFDAYQAWCGENSHKPLGVRTFGTKLSERGYRRDRTSQARGFSGIGLATSDVPF
jgi:putative DNA primase/helicase